MSIRLFASNAFSTQLRRYSTQPSVRESVIEFLSHCQKEERKKPVPDFYQLRSISAAIKSVSGSTQQIGLGVKIPGIGVKVQQLIDLYVTRLNKGEKPSKHETLADMNVISELQTIPGVSHASALKLFHQGCRSGSELVASEKFLSLFTPIQQGRILNHFQPLVTRSQAESVVAFMKKYLSPSYEMLLIGQYRLGEKQFHSIDVLITRPDFVYVPKPQMNGADAATKSIRLIRPKFYSNLTNKELNSPLHSDILHRLETRGLIAKTSGAKENMWQGIIRLPGEKGSNIDERLKAIKAKEGEYRQLNLWLVSPKSFGAAAIGLTGDKEFIRDMHIKALRLGLYLDTYGLWKWLDIGDNGLWKMIKAHTEEEIFETLGTSFIPPEKRNYCNVISSRRTRK